MHNDSQFSPQMVLVAFRILKYVCSGFLPCVLCSGLSDFFLSSSSSSSSSLSLSLSLSLCGLVQVLFLSLVVKFSFFNSHFHVTTMGYVCSQVNILTSLLCQWCVVVEISSV